MSSPFRLVSYPTRANADGTPDFSKYVSSTDTNRYRRVRLDFDVANQYHNKLYRNTFISGSTSAIANHVPLRRSNLTSSLSGSHVPDIGYLNTRFVPFDFYRERKEQNAKAGAVNPGILQNHADHINDPGKKDKADYLAKFFAPKAGDNTTYAENISIPSSGVFDIVFLESIAHAKSVFGYFVYDKNDPPKDWSDFQSGKRGKNGPKMDFVIVTQNTASRRYLTVENDGGGFFFDIYGLGNKEEDVYDGDMSPLTYGSFGVDAADQGGNDSIGTTDVEQPGLPPVGAYHASYRCVVPDKYVSSKGVYNNGDNLEFGTKDGVQSYYYCSNNGKETEHLNVLDITKELTDDWNNACKCDFAICPFIIRDAWDKDEKKMDMTPLKKAIETGEPQDRLFTALSNLNIDGKHHMVKSSQKIKVSEVLQQQNDGYKRITESAYVYGMEDYKDDGSNPQFIDYNDFVFYIRDADDSIDI